MLLLLQSAEGIAHLDDVSDTGLQSRAADREVDEAGSRNVNFVDKFTVRERSNNGRRKFTRIFSRRTSKTHRDVAREISMRGISRTLHAGSDRRISRCVRKVGQLRQRGINEIGNLGFQCVALCCAGKAGNS